MWRLFAWPERYMRMVALCVSCCAMTGCVESSFELASTSRLPQWTTPPPGLTRADVSVTMNYYTKIPIGRDVKFIEKDKNGKVLKKVSGKTRGLHPLRIHNVPEGSESLYSSYEVITVKGTTEIIEHKKMEPIFYVNDDPAVKKELLDTPKNDK